MRLANRPQRCPDDREGAPQPGHVVAHEIELTLHADHPFMHVVDAVADMVGPPIDQPDELLDAIGLATSHLVVVGQGHEQPEA